MKLNAYLLTADPAWIEASVLPYYAHVDRIIVSYDQSHTGWTGKPIDVEQCLRRLRRIDPDHKLMFAPGYFARPEFVDHPMAGETFQRQVALDQASDGVDWVLQLDSDEIIPNTSLFFDLLNQAHAAGSCAFNFPSRWIYARLGGRWYLEWCARGGRLDASFPGPVAVRAGSRFVVARRVEEGRIFHVDIAAKPGRGSYWQGGASAAVVSRRDCIAHLSMVRTQAWLERKFATWGHSKDKDWNPETRRWIAAHRQPIRTIIASHFSRGVNKRPLRPMQIPASVAELLAQSCVSDCDQTSDLWTPTAGRAA